MISFPEFMNHILWRIVVGNEAKKNTQAHISPIFRLKAVYIYYGFVVRFCFHLLVGQRALYDLDLDLLRGGLATIIKLQERLWWAFLLINQSRLSLSLIPRN